jgi:hypothetical protein
MVDWESNCLFQKMRECMDRMKKKTVRYILRNTFHKYNETNTEQERAEDVKCMCKYVTSIQKK